MARLGRSALQQSLAGAESTRLASATADDFRQYQSDVTRMIEVPHDG